MSELSTATPKSPREVFARLHRAVRDNYDMASQADLYAADGILEFPFAPQSLPRRVEGRDAIRRVLEAAGDGARRAGRRITAYSGVVIRETIDPEVIVAEFNLHGEVAGTGDTYRLAFIQVLWVRGGEIVEMRDYFAPTAMAATLAETIMPSPQPQTNATTR